MIRLHLTLLCSAVLAFSPGVARSAELQAGAAKVDITNRNAGPVNDPLYAKALVLSDGPTTVAIITVDAVAIAEIGSIPNEYLAKVRAQLLHELKIKPSNVLVNASHCHGIVCADIEQRTVQAVKDAYRNLVPVNVGAGVGHEDRIMENRRLKLKDGAESDVRHAYSLPPDEAVAEAGPVDPEIGILRLDRKDDGRTLAVVYNFACHPIQGVPSGGNTADITGFASKAIEDNLSEGTIALFFRGAAATSTQFHTRISTIPATPNRWGTCSASAPCGLRTIRCKPDGRFAIRNETIALPRADLAQRIAEREVEQIKLLQSLQGTTLSLKTFLPLAVKYGVSGEFPSSDSHHYFHEKMLGRNDLKKLDADNRANLKQYVDNIHIMEKLTRLQTNLALLRKHQARNLASGSKTIDVEVLGLRVGDFALVTFPGELTVRIGLDIKMYSPHILTFIAGYTNGYIYYSPTEDQLKNAGRAQEDSDCLLGPGWQAIFETKAVEILTGL